MADMQAIKAMQELISGFTADQIEMLMEKLDDRLVKQRKGDNKKDLDYLPLEIVIDQANVILGFGNWSPRIVKSKIVQVTDAEGVFVGSYYQTIVEISAKGFAYPLYGEGFWPIQVGTVMERILENRENAKRNTDLKAFPVEAGELRRAKNYIVAQTILAAFNAYGRAVRRALRNLGEQFGNKLYGSDDELTPWDILGIPEDSPQPQAQVAQVAVNKGTVTTAVRTTSANGHTSTNGTVAKGTVNGKTTAVAVSAPADEPLTGEDIEDLRARQEAMGPYEWDAFKDGCSIKGKVGHQAAQILIKNTDKWFDGKGKAWRSALLTEKQAEEIKVFLKEFEQAAYGRLKARMEITEPSSKFTRVQADSMIAVLRLARLLSTFAHVAEGDPTDHHLKTVFKVEHILDLFETEGEDLAGTYEAYLVDQVIKGGNPELLGEADRRAFERIKATLAIV